MDIAGQFKRFGYTTNMIYLTLEHINQSSDPVNERVNDGGHYVDLKSIQQNYHLGLQYLERFADRFDNLDILDASGSLFRLGSLLSIRQNQVVRLTKAPPEWIKPLLDRIVSRFNPGGRNTDEDDSLYIGLGR